MPGPSGFLPGVGRPASEPSQDKGYKRLKRASDFPYDMPILTGGARGIDSNGGGFVDMSQQHSRPLIPKDISHGPWDEETGELENEASSYPGLFSKSADSGMGGTIPGTAGGWAGSTRAWDAEDEVERAGSKRESAWDRLGVRMGILESRTEAISMAPVLLSFLPEDHRRGPSLVAALLTEEADGLDDDAGEMDTYPRWRDYR